MKNRISQAEEPTLGELNLNQKKNKKVIDMLKPENVPASENRALRKDIIDLSKSNIPYNVITVSKQRGINLPQVANLPNTTTTTKQWRVDGFLEKDSLVSIFGPPEGCKSLVAMDMALCIATGKKWKGHKTEQGPVFYITSEGSNGLVKNKSAWAMENNYSEDQLTNSFFLNKSAVNFFSKNSVVNIALNIENLCKKSGIPPALIIIDKLARNFGSNSSEDLNKFIENIDTYLRKRFKTTVLVIYHSGHVGLERGRGSSPLKAAMDTEYQITKKDTIVSMKCTKMKDATRPKPMSFNLEVVDLDISNKDGTAMTSVVLTQTDYVPIAKHIRPLGKNQNIVLSELRNLFSKQLEEMSSCGRSPKEAKITKKYWRKSSSLEAKCFNESSEYLIKKGLVSVDGAFVSLTESSDSI